MREDAELALLLPDNGLAFLLFSLGDVRDGLVLLQFLWFGLVG